MDFEVWKRAHNFFDFETLKPIKAKGYVNPVPVFRPLEQALKDDHNKVSNGVQRRIDVSSFVAAMRVIDYTCSMLVMFSKPHDDVNRLTWFPSLGSPRSDPEGSP